MSAIPTRLRRGLCGPRWSDEPVAHQCAGQSCRTRGQDQRSTPPTPVWPGAGVSGMSARRSSCAHRTTSPLVTRTAAGRYRVTFAVAMPDANYCWTALARRAPTAGTQPSPSAIQHRPEDKPRTSTSSCATTSASFDDSSGNQPHGVPALMADLHTSTPDALEAALVKGRKSA